ncbi:hypothetical protein ACVWW5_007385 [Bradyrhizobium sp. LM3.4]
MVHRLDAYAEVGQLLAQLIECSLTSNKDQILCYCGEGEMSEREEWLWARPTPVEVRCERAGFIRFQVEMIQVVPRAVNIVGHASEDGQIWLLQSDSRRHSGVDLCRPKVFDP